jgi:signal transduction histidine kinase/ActR/RegA family two-component response regulator/PAS domain-containing protein/HPt (histidine-containing phosphotransfer) domain-containing protein
MNEDNNRHTDRTAGAVALVGQNVDENELRALLGDMPLAIVRLAAVSRGVRQLEARPDALVLVAPDATDDSWERALCRIRDEVHVRPLLLAAEGSLVADPEMAARALEAGAHDVFELGVVTRAELARSLRHMACCAELINELAAERTKSRWVEETGRLGTWEMDAEGTVTWSDGAALILDLDADGAGLLTGDFMSVRQFVLPEDREIFDQANKATFGQGWPLDFEYRITTGSGTIRHLHLHRRVETGPGGEVIRAYGMVRDVTAEREFENFLFRRDAISQVVGSFAGKFLRESDWEGGIESALYALAKASDVTRAFIFRTLPGRGDQAGMSLVQEWAAPGIESIKNYPDFESAAFSGPSRWRTSMLKHRVVAGHVRTVWSGEKPLFDHFGAKSIITAPIFVGDEWWGFVGFSEHREERDWQPVEIESLTMVADIFGSAILRRRMEERLVEANRLAEEAKTTALEASKTKSRFLANMSHEIRTPISGILGMAEMTITTGLSNEQRKNMDMIRDAARSLLGIVNDVLDISKIEASRMELAPEDFDLPPLLDTVTGPFAAQAEGKGVLLRHRTDPDVPSRLRGDPDRLTQILVNLLGNALKFTERGLIELRVKTAGTEPGRTCLLFSVRDTGEGIDPDKLETIFESFTQADGSVRKKHQGTGLGLTIARELVELMGGTIRAESEPDQGATFTFTAWFDAPVQEKAPAPKQAAAPRGLHLNILLAEDNPLNQKFLTHFLTMFGHTVAVADNGRQALEILALRGRELDLVLMDIQMPEMSGIEATRTIRAADGRTFDPRIPIIALTAYAMTGDRERITEAGMDDYVSKPVDMKELSAAIARSVPDQKPVRGQAVVGAPASAPRGGRAAGRPAADEAFQLDMPALIERFQGNTAMLEEILDLFLAESQARLKELDAGIRSGEPEALGATLHALTNLAGHVLATGIMVRARHLESLCNKGRVDEARSGAEELRGAFHELVRAVRRGAETLADDPSLHFD